MTLPLWREEAVGRQDRESFDCGDPALNGFLQHHARRNHERGASKTFLAISRSDGAILGYYTLSPTDAEIETIPESLRKGLGRYPVGGFRLARLAVAAACQNGGLGGQLLMAAGLRCIRATAEVGGSLIFIDAKNDRVADWYRSYGALRLDDRPLSLFLPLASIAAGLRVGGKLPSWKRSDALTLPTTTSRLSLHQRPVQVLRKFIQACLSSCCHQVGVLKASRVRAEEGRMP